jgi:hypothetical protein
VPSDPVADAQEEAMWSGYSHYYRAFNQGKWVFRRPDPRNRRYRSAWRMGALYGVLFVFALAAAGWAVVTLVKLFTS